MARFSLGCYTMRMIDRRTRENLPLGDLGDGSDLMFNFTEFLEARKIGRSIDDARQKLLHVLYFHVPSTTSVSGIVETGEYGYTADLYNVDTNITSYQRIPSDAEMMPFYFLAHLPAIRDEGVILLQRRSNIGIRTAFLRDFADFFQVRYPRFRIASNPLVPPQLINEYLNNGRLTKVRLIRYGLPSDLADTLPGGHVEREGSAEMVFLPPRGGSLRFWDRIRDVFDGKTDVREMIEFPGYEYDNVKVEIDVGGSRKTLDLSNVMKMRAYVDVTPDVQVGDDGHPEFRSMEKVAQELMDSLLADLGIGRRNV